MTTKPILAFAVTALALAASLAAPGKAFAGLTDAKADVPPAPSCAEFVQPAATQSNTDDNKHAASTKPDQKERRPNRGYDWQSYRDRYEPDYRRYLDRRWIPSRHRKDDD